MSVCPDKSNTSHFGDTEVAILGYMTLPCSASLLQNFQFYLQGVSAKIRTPLMSKYVFLRFFPPLKKRATIESIGEVAPTGCTRGMDDHASNG
jgi:hypothetical protein